MQAGNPLIEQLSCHALSKLDCGILLLDAQQNVLLQNNWLQKFTLRGVEPGSDNHFHTFYPEAVAERLHCAIEDALNKRVSAKLSYTLNPNVLGLKDPAFGDPIPHSVTVIPVDQGGEPCCMLHVIDETTQVHKEQSLQRYTEQVEMQKSALDLAARNARSVAESKSAFFNAVSHEFRTPLNAILGFSQMFVQNLLGELDAEQMENMQQIYQASLQLQGFLNQLLHISSLEQKNLTKYCRPVNLGSTAGLCVGQHQAQAVQRGIEIELQSCCLEVQCNKESLQHVFDNFLQMAIKANEDKTVVRITSECSLGSIKVLFAGDFNRIPLKQDVLNRLPVKQAVETARNTDLNIEFLLELSANLLQVSGGRMGYDKSALWFSLPIESTTD